MFVVRNHKQVHTDGDRGFSFLTFSPELNVGRVFPGVVCQCAIKIDDCRLDDELECRSIVKFVFGA